MKKSYSYFAAVALGLLTLGCSKTKETPAPSKTDLLSDKNWIVSAETVSPGVVVAGATITDVYGQFQSCQKDDFIRFEKPNVFKDDEGAVKCTQTDPQTTTGTWVFNSDQTIITITPQGGSPQSLNIQELTDSSLKITTSAVQNNVNYTFTITYRKG
ncbi:lipocalin family protein [Hymenobacter sp. M29]|uniref:Lipocalin family protein n=1 Tax=Hymenobacter mellowenesis TaxID=3063995 RepID=A0ABT9AGE8_9BACT|nr:lipocalin family protein [Hymenobacter sp. M29]MDO7848938.1 lipocalin family protein [Hymenobacter sp. M29]